MNYVSKLLYRAARALMDCIGQLGLNGWARVKRERTKSRERLLRTRLFYSGHLQHKRKRPDMELKYMNSDKVQRKKPKLTTSWSGTVVGGTNIQNKLARILRYKS